MAFDVAMRAGGARWGRVAVKIHYKFIASDALAIIENLLLRQSLVWQNICYYDKKYHTKKVFLKRFRNSEESV